MYKIEQIVPQAQRQYSGFTAWSNVLEVQVVSRVEVIILDRPVCKYDRKYDANKHVSDFQFFCTQFLLCQ